MELVHVLWQVAVGEPQQRSLSVGFERDLDRALAGRYGQRSVLQILNLSIFPRYIVLQVLHSLCRQGAIQLKDPVALAPALSAAA